jgi:3D (Asp-Asp-Asp) domain-containing protein
VKDHIISFLIGILIGTPLLIATIRASEPEPVNLLNEDTVKDLVITTVQVCEFSAGAGKVLDRPVQVVEKTYLGEFKISAYCPCEVCCPGTSDGLTYSETVATEGRTISVDPDVIPLGSIVEIDGKRYVAEDIGSAIDENRADIYFDSHADAREWGVQYHDVYIIGS